MNRADCMKNWFSISSDIEIPEAKNIQGYVMGVYSKNKSLANKFSQTIIQEGLVDSRILFDYGQEFCKARDLLISEMTKPKCEKRRLPNGLSISLPSYKCTILPTTDGAILPKLTAVSMNQESASLSRYSYPHSFFISFGGATVSWEEMWKTQMLDDYEIENRSKNLCYSDFLLMYSRTTLSQIKADIQKIINTTKQPPIPKNYLRNVLQPVPVSLDNVFNGNVRKQSWRMMNGGGRIPSITVMCALLEVDDDYVNSIAEDSSRVQEFSAMIDKQRERQEEREEKIRKENEMRLQRERRIRYNFYNRHSRDGRIACSDDTFVLDGKKIDSVRFVVNSLFPRFDTQERVLKYSAIKGISVEALRKQWSEKGAGTRRKTKDLLANIEKYYKEENVTRSTEFLQFLDFAKSVNLKPYRSSWQIFDEERGLGGTVDFVTKDASSQKLVLYSFTTKDYVVSNGLPIRQNEDGECAKAPIANIPSTSFYKFALELSFYKFILEEFYNVSVSELRLGVFSDNNAKGYIIRMPYLKDEIERIMDARNDVIF